MKRMFLISTLATLLAASSAMACTAEYKAQRSDPTGFEHTTMSVPADKCNLADAERYVRDQLALSGWVLLKLVKVSG